MWKRGCKVSPRVWWQERPGCFRNQVGLCKSPISGRGAAGRGGWGGERGPRGGGETEAWEEGSWHGTARAEVSRQESPW